MPYVMKHDEDFRKRVKNKIKELSAAEGIDIEKYCFDISSKERLLKQDQNNEQMEKTFVIVKSREGGDYKNEYNRPNSRYANKN